MYMVLAVVALPHWGALTPLYEILGVGTGLEDAQAIARNYLKRPLLAPAFVSSNIAIEDVEPAFFRPPYDRYDWLKQAGVVVYDNGQGSNVLAIPHAGALYLAEFEDRIRTHFEPYSENTVAGYEHDPADDLTADPMWPAS
jgi:hypothetical protein